MDAFAAKFPHAWGISGVSKVGLNGARTQAMVFVGNNCGFYCYHTETLVFRKKAQKWVLQERIPYRSQDGPGVGETRYLGVNPQFLPRQRRVQDSTRKAVADSILRDKAPRRIRGTITNRQTGRPIPYAQVLVFGPRKYDPNVPLDPVPHPDRRIVADSRGKYTISNPSVGLTMLVVLCPGLVYFDRPSLGAPGIVVSPGTDTTFNFAAQDLSACWGSIKMHPLESGWLESAEARDASVPDEEESRVMAVVIGNLQADHPDQRIVGMRTHTLAPCRFAKLCGSVQLPRLVHEKAVDSGTVKDFKARTKKPAVVKPDFVRSLGLRVITDQESAYLSGQAEWPYGWPAWEGKTDSTRFWKAFRTLYGERAAIAAVTRVGFNASRTQALVEARTDTAFENWMGAPSRMMLLEKRNDVWTIVNANVGQGTTSGAMEGTSCVASAAPSEKPSRSQIEALDGIFELTIVVAGVDERTEKMLLRIGHNMPARWISPRPGVTPEPPSFPQSFELLNADGSVNPAGTMGISIIGMPRNVVRDPNIVQLDGVYENLTILSVTNAGFSGSYVNGAFGDSNFGYFCARRVSAVK